MNGMTLFPFYDVLLILSSIQEQLGACMMQWVPLNSVSKYVEELGPIKQDSQISRDRIKQNPLYLISMII